MSQKNVLLALGSYQHMIHRGVASYARIHGWHISADMAYGSPPPKHWQGDGIVTALQKVDSDLARVVMACHQRGVPVVDLTCNCIELSLPRVVGDHKAMGRLAGFHFKERQLTSVAYYSQNSTPTSQLRYEGFVEACGRTVVRINVDPEAQWDVLRRQILQQIQRLPKPLGVFAYNDYQASQIVDAAIEGGFLVPEHVAVIGVDNDGLVSESSQVPITSIAHDLETLGSEGCVLLDRLMNGEKVSREPCLVSPKGIIARLSTLHFAHADIEVGVALRWMYHHFTEDVQVEDVVFQTHVQRRTLEKRFKEQVGRTLHEELRRLRIERAQEMLSTTVETLDVVAKLSGLKSAAYLVQVFRQHVGMTPGQWRQRTQRTSSVF